MKGESWKHSLPQSFDLFGQSFAACFTASKCNGNPKGAGMGVRKSSIRQAGTLTTMALRNSAQSYPYTNCYQQLHRPQLS
jgi:hypothetical protein